MTAASSSQAAPRATLTRTAWRLRLLATSAALTALAFVQAPGQVVADTKLDLAVAPAHLLGRTLHLWDPLGDWGQVQNQAYGYLFPMGPFFLGGHGIGLPDWAVQRAWWALVLVVAFLGMVKLCSALRVGTPWARILVGVLFALSPRLITNLGAISIESWPESLAPWVLVPLVLGARRSLAPRRAAALSAVAVGFVGGVNAVASAAVLPLSALWLLTRRRGARRGAMMRWWPLFVAMATLWWLVPLLVLGHYSPPFLSYIESSATTTATGTVMDALRGTTKWVPYISTTYVAGRPLVTSPLIILNSGIVVVVGLVGLARKDMPERRFLLLALLVGLVLLTMGHTGSFEGLGAAHVQNLLDGALAPLRNTHKWDVVVRIPLLLGVAHVVSVAGEKVASGSPQPLLRVGVAVLVTAAAVGSTVTAWSTHLTSAGSFSALPSYWTSAVSWMDAHQTDGRTYVTPASGFGDFTWGTPSDEPVQALAHSAWATRSVVPLVPGGTIRTMDAIEDRLSTGVGSAGLLSYLQRAGVTYLLVRYDLRDTSVPTSRYDQAIAETPGLTKVRSFGPEVGGTDRIDQGKRSAVFVQDGLRSKHRAIEIYRVATQGASSSTASFASGDLPVVVGDSESLLTATEVGLLGDQPVELARDADTSRDPGTVVLTDGSRRQEVSFGSVRDNRTASLTPSTPYTYDRAAHDYDTGTSSRWETVPELVGASGLTASSSASDADEPGRIEPSEQPYAALDHDDDTAWVSGPDAGGAHWLRVTFPHAVDVSRVRITVPAAHDARTRPVSIRTAAGSVTTEVAPGDTSTVTTASGPTTYVEVRASSDLSQPLRIADLSIPGVHVARPLVLPTVPKAWSDPSTILLSTGTGEQPGCVTVGDDVRCAEGAERLSEDGRTIDRVVDLHSGATRQLAVRVRPWGTSALDAAVQKGRTTQVVASSNATHSALSGAYASVDGDPHTGWIAASADSDPSLTVTWPTTQRITSITATVGAGLVSSKPTGAILDFGDGRTRAVRLTDGHATFKAVRSDTVRVRFVKDDEATSVSADGSSGRALPVGVGELSFGGAPLDTTPLDTTVVDRACGTGPTVTVDGVQQPTRLIASDDDLYEGRLVTALPCSGTSAVTFQPGGNRVTVGHTDVVRPESMVIGDATLPANAPASVDVTSDRATSGTLSVSSPSGGLLLERQNVNTGWKATSDGRTLTPVVVDGWQQAWLLQPGDTTVTTRFAPDRTYRLGLLAGALTLVALWALALWRRLGSALATAPALRPARPGWTLAAALLVVVGLGIGGVAGLSAVVVGGASATAAGALLRRTGHEPDLWWVVAGWMSGAVLAYVLRPAGGADAWAGLQAWPQWLALAGVSSAVLAGFDLRESRWARLIAGRSTTR